MFDRLRRIASLHTLALVEHSGTRAYRWEVWEIRYHAGDGKLGSLLGQGVTRRDAIKHARRNLRADRVRELPPRPEPDV